MADRPNLAVPDELAAIRDEIRRLEERQEVLRGIILDDPDTRSGNRFIADIKVTKQQRTDLAELRACHADLVAEFTFPVEITRIVLSEIDADTGEITPRRRSK